MSRAYTVHAPSGADAPERFAFVKDGISWPALFVPILWILWHRLWLTLIGIIIFVLLVAWTGRLWNDDIAAVVAIIGAILFALEANNIRRLSLARRGWRDAGSSFGATIEEAEMRFFHDWGKGAAPVPPAEPRETAKRAAPGGPDRQNRSPEGSDERIFGLFPEPER